MPIPYRKDPDAASKTSSSSGSLAPTPSPPLKPSRARPNLIANFHRIRDLCLATYPDLPNADRAELLDTFKEGIRMADAFVLQTEEVYQATCKKAAVIVGRRRAGPRDNVFKDFRKKAHLPFGLEPLNPRFAEPRIPEDDEGWQVRRYYKWMKEYWPLGPAHEEDLELYRSDQSEEVGEMELDETVRLTGGLQGRRRLRGTAPGGLPLLQANQNPDPIPLAAAPDDDIPDMQLSDSQKVDCGDGITLAPTNAHYNLRKRLATGTLTNISSGKKNLPAATPTEKKTLVVKLKIGKQNAVAINNQGSLSSVVLNSVATEASNVDTHPSSSPPSSMSSSQGKKRTHDNLPVFLPTQSTNNDRKKKRPRRNTMIPADLDPGEGPSKRPTNSTDTQNTSDQGVIGQKATELKDLFNERLEELTSEPNPATMSRKAMDLGIVVLQRLNELVSQAEQEEGS